MLDKERKKERIICTLTRRRRGEARRGGTECEDSDNHYENKQRVTNDKRTKLSLIDLMEIDANGSSLFFFVHDIID